MAMRGNSRIECGCRDPLVFREQIVGELVEKRDSPNHRRRRDEMIAVFQEVLEQRDTFGVALHERIQGVFVVRFVDRAILAEIVEPNDLIARLKQFFDEVAADKTGSAGNEYFHGYLSGIHELGGFGNGTLGLWPESPDVKDRF